MESAHRPAEALPYAEHLTHLAQRARQNQPGSYEAELWLLGKIKYLAGSKDEAIQYWRTLPFYQRLRGEELLGRYIDGCERRLAQYEANRREQEKWRSRKTSP